MEALDKEFLQYLGSMGKAFGLDDLPLKIFGVLYLEPAEISMDDIAIRTGYSLASISNTMKMLESMGQIKRIKRPGTKKVYFYMNKDLIAWNLRKLQITEEAMIKPAKAKLPEIISRYKKKAKDDEAKKKVQIIESYLKQVLLFEKLLENMRKELERIAAGGKY